jgi:hypothetical protein
MAYQSVYYSHSGEDRGTCYLRDDDLGWSSFKYYPTVYYTPTIIYYAY